MLWACLHFPDFSLQLLLRGAPSPGPVIISTGGNRPTVLSCNPQARSHGIAPGMKVSAAIALAPDLVEHPRDATAERHALERTAAWAGQFTSMVSLAPPDALLLEIEGSLRLLGGLRQSMLRLSSDLAELGYSAALAVAPTPTGARLLARAGLEATLTDTASLESALAGLPLALLDQPADTVRMLSAMGVHTIGACLALPRDGLARRFGQSLMDELDRALGRLPDPRAPYIPPSRYRARLALPAPVQEIEPLLFAAKRLILELAGFLRMKQAGITRLKLTLRHEDQRPTVVTLGFSVPSRDPQRILRLLRERLARVELPDRVEAIAAGKRGGAAPRVAQLSRCFRRTTCPRRSAGRSSITCARAWEWTPCTALHRMPIIDRSSPGARASPAPPQRVTGSPSVRSGCSITPRRLQVEERDSCARRTRSSLLAGPQRIEGGWWDGNDVMRDYFVAADAQGRRFWIFRERGTQSTWFLQGIFA